MKSLKHKSIFSAIFAIVMVLSILSLPVYAETNHGGSGAGGETGKVHQTGNIQLGAEGSG